MQPVAGPCLLISVKGVTQVKPSPLPGIPCNRQALQTSSFERYQILLQGSVPQGIGYLKILKSAVGSFGVDEEFFALAEESVHLSPVPELKIIEITKNGAVRCDVHRQIMV